MRPNKTLVSIIIALSAIFCWIPNQTATSQTDEMYHPVQLSLGRIYGVDWQPNGNAIAIAGSQGVRLYTDEFEFLKQLSSTETQLVSWSPDGTEIASVSQGQLTLWDVASGNSIFTLNGVGCPMSFSPDGNLLAVGIENGEIKIVNSLTGAVITTYLGQSVPNNENSTFWTQPETIGWSADGSSVISVGGKPQEIHVWDSQAGQFAEEVALEGFQHDQSCAKGMAWSPDRQKVFNLLSNPDTGSAAIWNIESGAVIAVTQELLTLPEFLRTAWSPDGTKIALIDSDLNLTLWDATTLNVISTRELSPHSIYAPYITTGSRETEFNIDWSFDNTRILVSSIGGASILNAETGAEIESLQGYTGWTNAIAWSPDSQYIATAHGSKEGYGDDRIRIWDANSNENIITCKGHIGSVNDIAWNSNGSQLASVAGNGNRADGTLRIWNVTTCQMLDALWSGTLSVNAVDWKPDGSQVLLKGAGIVILSPNLAELETIPVYATTAQWSLNGEKLAVATIKDVALRIYDAQDFTLASTLTGYSHPIMNIAWNSDGNKVATISYNDNDISITDFSSGNRTTLTGHNAPVTAISWNAQNNLLASAASDNTIRIWDMATGTEIAVFENQVGITDLAWSPDGTMLASCSETGDVIIWR